MDLVSTYNSDGEGDSPENKKEQPKKEIDVIVLSDSDSDNDPPVKEGPVKNSNAVNDKSLNTATGSLNNIECIDIDESENEESNTIDKNEINASKATESDASQTKKKDYLNLEGSDSDIEEEKTQEKVQSLLSSASVLSKVPCGPDNRALRKDDLNVDLPPPLCRTDLDCHKSCSLPQKKLDGVVQSENKGLRSECIVQDNFLLPEGITKRFKRETETPKSTVSAIDTIENEESHPPSTFMYRKDERITGAFAKSVVSRLPRLITRSYIGHVSIITSLQWCIPQYSHLLLSASVDCTMKIWDMCCRHPVQTLKDNSGFKAAKWSLSGEQIIAGGYGKKARVFDVLSGKEIISYDVFHHISSIEIHPYMDDVFLCGTHNAIFGYDLRVNSALPVRTFLSKCEEVLDIAFLDENEFVCSTSVVSHDSADRTIMVWDFSSGAVMSNQVFLELYTCPFLKVHPQDSCFIAQTNGDYIAAFSTQKPYKLKDKRYMGHKVSSYGVECDFSPDGKYLASGDASGDIYFYNYSNTNVINKLSVRTNMATNRLKWHPALNSTLASATWDGHIQIWK